MQMKYICRSRVPVRLREICTPVRSDAAGVLFISTSKQGRHEAGYDALQG